MKACVRHTNMTHDTYTNIHTKIMHICMYVAISRSVSPSASSMKSRGSELALAEFPSMIHVGGPNIELVIFHGLDELLVVTVSTNQSGWSRRSRP